MTAKMNAAFLNHIGRLDAKVDALVTSPAFRYADLPRGIPKCGVYLFSRRPGEHLYVGRSRRIRTRLGNHCRQTARHNQASFAFLLARERTGKVAASYSTKGSRAELCKDPEFCAAFDSAKTFLRSLDIRFVEESDPVTQALLEIYAAIRLDTRYNDFNTH
jgi:hypothetical protein